MYSEDDLLPISALEHLYYCERQVALIHLERQWQDNTFTAEGSILHEQAHQADTESRSEIRTARGLWLRSLRLGLYGKADVVEFRLINDDTKHGVTLPGAAGLWQPFPVEYKRGRLRSEASFEVQLCAQGLCLEEMLGIKVTCGALYYGKTHRRLEIELDNKLRQKTESAVTHLRKIIDAGITPGARRQPKCKSCSMVGLCLPGLSDRRKNISDYLKKAIAGAE